MHRIRRGLALASTVVAGVALTPGVANATPSSGVSGTIISQVTVGGEDYILRQITIQPGGTTGWHWHDGTLYAYVERGTLTHTDADCTTTDVYRRGAVFIEPSGADHVHVGRNLGTAPLVLDVLYVDPAGSPLSEDAPNPGCSFQ
ncbi:Cupin 2 conserved barrel domain protein [Catenulispora acidiphila DSM 44928]|uniref:Cupin 2 conserved barrel domain protein n=1 Tax=Catenulispora acidiphila (strain DSM 44928 / JCM 14897 / NBRC 102108 / NRRL B-24433 / ID139908) TaxID=479433 RepID=C7Q3C7_CATAD|nr:cupin domain-containing protein [Catenulispora acidiphila]ACU73863.1 Cupin 2 conserved barrel domain protein [Catenulispora acidiphila DSM 44928]